jgi:hypothetical protein
MRELMDKPLVDDAIDAYVDCGRSAPQFGMSTSGSPLAPSRRRTPRWLTRCRRTGPAGPSGRGS